MEYSRFSVDPKQAGKFVKYIKFLIVKDLSQMNDPKQADGK